MGEDSLLVLGFREVIAQLLELYGPVRRPNAVEQEDVEVVRVEFLAEAINGALRIVGLPPAELRHELVGVARDALEGGRQHLVHFAV